MGNPSPRDIIHREKGKKWKLPKVICAGHGVMFQKHYFYEVVEYRRPKKGEWYLSGAIPKGYQAPNDLSQEYLVINLKEEAVQKTVWIRKEEASHD